MKVDGKSYNMLSWEEEYCRYYNIGIIVYCNVNLREEVGTLIKIRWIDETENVFGENLNINMISRFIREKILLAVTEDYGSSHTKYPNYNYYAADLKANIKKQDTNIIIENITINTHNCVRPDNTMKLHLSGSNILPNEILKEKSIEGSSNIFYEFVAPLSVPITEYYYNEDNNEFIKFDHNTNTKERTTLMVDLDPLTLELIQKMDPKGRKLLNMRLSNVISEVIEEINYLINPDDYINEDESN